MEKMKIKGNIIIGIVAFSAIAWITGLGQFNGDCFFATTNDTPDDV